MAKAKGKQRKFSVGNIVGKSELETVIGFTPPIKITEKGLSSPYDVIKIKLRAVSPNFEEPGHLYMDYSNSKTTTAFCLSRGGAEQIEKGYDSISESAGDHLKVYGAIWEACRTNKPLDLQNILS